MYVVHVSLHQYPVVADRDAVQVAPAAPAGDGRVLPVLRAGLHGAEADARGRTLL